MRGPWRRRTIVARTIVACFVVGAFGVGQPARGQMAMPALGNPESIFSGETLEQFDLATRNRLMSDFHRQLRYLESSIKMSEAEVDSWKRRLVEYSYFQKFVHSDPFIHDREFCRLNLVDAELRVKMLKRDRLDLLRYRSDPAHCRSFCETLLPLGPLLPPSCFQRRGSDREKTPRSGTACGDRRESPSRGFVPPTFHSLVPN